MMTQTHLLVGAALFCSPARSWKQNAAVLAGAMAPDAAIYALFTWSKFAGIPERQLWNEIYFSEPMLTYTAIGNSAPLYALIAILGLAGVKAMDDQLVTLEERRNAVRFHGSTGPQYTNVLVLFGLAALAHIALDFPVHANDAHPHFWPITDWRFTSPISYWDPAYYGDMVSAAEAIFGIVLTVTLFRRFKAPLVRIALAGLAVAYLAVPIYFQMALA
ncbi:MAG: metal-dependent hydrolase [Pseudomonadota bacterium]